jgi:hypothetical protein
MRMLFCDVCDRKLTIDETDEFNYTEDGSGPYCDVCFHFQWQIEALERKVARCCKEPPIVKRASPYDASARRR